MKTQSFLRRATKDAKLNGHHMRWLKTPLGDYRGICLHCGKTGHVQEGKWGTGDVLDSAIPCSFIRDGWRIKRRFMQLEITSVSTARYLGCVTAHYRFKYGDMTEGWPEIAGIYLPDECFHKRTFEPINWRVMAYIEKRLGGLYQTVEVADKLEDIDEDE